MFGRVWDTYWAPISDDMYLHFAMDVTERHAAEHAVTQAALELARSNKDLEQFAYAASHDLQEPLRVITGYLQLLERRYGNKLGKEPHEFIAFAVDASARMQQLIHDLLAYSRVGTRAATPRPTDSEHALKRAIANLMHSIEDAGAVITHDSLPTVMADETLLMQVFQNLLPNAIKFRREHPPRIHVGVECNDNHWLFSVRDNGIGIESPYLDRVFQVFQRLHTREAYPGTGIGLALCKRVIERYGGTIHVESMPGEGSVFYFTLGASDDGKENAQLNRDSVS